MKTLRILTIACLATLSGCKAFHPREADDMLEGVKGDATYNYSGFLGGTTAIAEGYENTEKEAKANRLYLQKKFPWGSSASVDIRNYRRDKTVGETTAGSVEIK